VNEHDRTAGWFARLNSMELYATAALDPVVLHHLPPFLKVVPISGTDSLFLTTPDQWHVSDPTDQNPILIVTEYSAVP